MSLKNQNWKSTTQDKMQIGKTKKKKKKKKKMEGNFPH